MVNVNVLSRILFTLYSVFPQRFAKGVIFSEYWMCQVVYICGFFISHNFKYCPYKATKFVALYTNLRNINFIICWELKLRGRLYEARISYPPDKSYPLQRFFIDFIRGIRIYPRDSAIRPSYNRPQSNKVDQLNLACKIVYM